MRHGFLRLCLGAGHRRDFSVQTQSRRNPLQVNGTGQGRGWKADQNGIENGAPNVRSKPVNGHHGSGMGGDQPVRGRQPGDHRQSEPAQLPPGLGGQRLQNRNQQHQAHAEKHGEPDDESHEGQRPGKVVFSQDADEPVRHDFRTSRLSQQFAEHGSQPHHHRDESQRGAHPFLKGFRDIGHRHAGAESHHHRRENDAEESVEFPSSDQGDQSDHGHHDPEEDLQLRFGRHGELGKVGVVRRG